MLCDNCLHKIVCKEVANFKKYEDQYIEMRKISSLFDKPIEYPCYLDRTNLHYATSKGNKVDKNIVHEDLIELQKRVYDFLGKYERITNKLPVVLIGFKEERENIKENFNEIVKKLKVINN